MSRYFNSTALTALCLAAIAAIALLGGGEMATSLAGDGYGWDVLRP